MDDRLEKYIKDHREDMDYKSPREDLWETIKNELKDESKQRHLSRSVFYWRAAAVILLLITSWLAFDKLAPNSNGDSVEIASINPQLFEAETYYISLIDQKREEIRVMSQKYGLGNDFLHDIDQLDSMYAVLKNDMATGDEENLVDAMILNLQLRIEILNQQLSIIQSIENSQQDETIIL